MFILTLKMKIVFCVSLNLSSQSVIGRELERDDSIFFLNDNKSIIRKKNYI